jgi:hypothetical protein
MPIWGLCDLMCNLTELCCEVFAYHLALMSVELVGADPTVLCSLAYLGPGALFSD